MGELWDKDLDFSAGDGRWAEEKKIVLLSEVLQMESLLSCCVYCSGAFLSSVSPGCFLIEWSHL